MVSYGFLWDHKTYNLPDFKVGKFGLCPLGDWPYTEPEDWSLKNCSFFYMAFLTHFLQALVYNLPKCSRTQLVLPL